MTIELGTLVKASFSFLEKDFGFIVTHEESLDSGYSIEYSSTDVVIKIEKYRRELYCYISRTGDPDSAVHLFNLLRYLHRGTLPEISLHYFSYVEDVSESFRLQAELISKEIKEKYSVIMNFFDSPNYKNNISRLNSYLIQQNSNLFKT